MSSVLLSVKTSLDPYIKSGFYVQTSHWIKLVRYQERTSYFGRQSVSRTINICETGPQPMIYSSFILTPRMLALVSVHVDLKENSTGHIYEVKPNSFLMGQYPNLVIIPVIHIMSMQTDTTTPLVIISLSTELNFLAKCEILGFLEQVDTEICEIMTSSDLGLLPLGVTAEQSENPLPYREGQFISFSADVPVHRKVDLQDLEVGESIQNILRPLYQIYSSFFSNDSEDFGHTDLVTMDIDTGDNPRCRHRGQSTYLTEVL